MRQLQATQAALRRAEIAQRRTETALGRAALRDFTRERRERTRHLIELGELVQRVGLVELLGDDRAVLLGAFLDVADRLRGGTPMQDAGAARDGSGGTEARPPDQLVAAWRRRGLQALKTADAAVPGRGEAEE